MASRAVAVRCYEKVKGEISLFRDIVDLLKVLLILFRLLTIASCLPALDMSTVLVKVFVSVLRSETENRTLLLTAAGGV